jgi:hypothetical protein
VVLVLEVSLNEWIAGNDDGDALYRRLIRLMRFSSQGSPPSKNQGLSLLEFIGADGPELQSLQDFAL